MPLPAALLIAATLLPLAGFMTLVALGRRMGAPLAGYVATFFVAAAFLCSGGALVTWISATGGAFRAARWGKNVAPLYLAFHWIPIRGGCPFGIYLDSLTVSVCVTLTFVATLVHFFALSTWRDQDNQPRSFASLAFLVFATMGFVVSGSLIQLLAFWIVLGVASFAAAALPAGAAPTWREATNGLILQRLGVIAFLLAFAMLFVRVGSPSLPQMWTDLARSAGGSAAATAAAVALFAAAASQAGQFPFQNSMAGTAVAPAPASALFQSVTTTGAGIFLLARLFPVLTSDARLLLVVIGAATVVVSSLISLAQSDVRKLLGFNTSAHLGLMVLAIGIGSWVGALFHLVAHAFCKALMVLAVGCAAEAGSETLESFGGLWRKMPVTAITFALAILGIGGVGALGVGLAGYHSQHIILAHAATLEGPSGRPAFRAVFIIAAASVPLSALALTRCWMLLFWGSPRDPKVYERAGERPLMYWPLILLAAMTLLAGRWIGVGDLLDGAVRETRQVCQDLAAAPGGAGQLGALSDRLPADEVANSPNEREDPAAARADRVLWLGSGGGILIGILLYVRGPGLMRRVVRVPPLSWLYAWLHNAMYFGDLYDSVIAVPVLGAAQLAYWFENHVLDPPLLRILAAASFAHSRGGGPRCMVQAHMPGSVAILDALGSLMEAERNSVFRLMGEHSPYLRQAPQDVRTALQEMVRSSQQHEDELRDTIRTLSGSPGGRTRPQPDEPLLNFLSLKFLLPKLVNSKELMIERYQNALRAITAQDGEAVPVLRRHLAQHEQDLETLHRAAKEVLHDHSPG